MRSFSQRVFLACALSGLAFTVYAQDATRPLFNGRDLSGWVNVIGSKGTWQVGDEVLSTTGAPKGVLRTDRQYENFTLEFDYQVAGPSAPAGVLLHSDALPAMGQPWPRGILVRCDAGAGKNVMTPTDGARIEPVVLSVKSGNSPSWNHCKIESRDGHIAIAVNGQMLAVGNYALPRKGYIALRSDGSPIRFRNITLREMPSSNPPSYLVAAEDEGFVSLFDGVDLERYWEMKPGHAGHWMARDWIIDYDGASQEQDKCLWTRAAYGDFVLVADLRFTGKPVSDRLPVVLPGGDNLTDEKGNPRTVEVLYGGDTGIYVRGHSKNQVNMGNRYIGSGEIYGYRSDRNMPPEVRKAAVPAVKADNPPGEWNRYVITMKGDRITVDLNGMRVIDNAFLPGIAPRGKIALQDDHASGNLFQFANLFIKELN